MFDMKRSLFDVKELKYLNKEILTYWNRIEGSEAGSLESIGKWPSNIHVQILKLLLLHDVWHSHTSICWFGSWEEKSIKTLTIESTSMFVVNWERKNQETHKFLLNSFSYFLFILNGTLKMFDMISSSFCLWHFSDLYGCKVANIKFYFVLGAARVNVGVEVKMSNFS